ncbi:MAG TPA: hypothetical protein VFQ38_08555 [Longimicrobiales bacterium]|nr:hypothetical protein [Longimicrobiales bacterium]
MRERHLVVTRTARYAVLGEAVRRPEEVWFVLHGYGQLARRFIRGFEPLDDGRRLIVAPEGLNRYYLDDAGGPHGPEARVGATWMTRDDRLTEISDYVSYLDTLYRHTFAELDLDRDDTRVVALGFSQGAATVSRWTAIGAARPDLLVLWGSPAPPDLELDVAAAAWADLQLALVYGTEDTSYGEAHAVSEAERLRVHGLSPRLVGFEGGHAIDPDVLQELARR